MDEHKLRHELAERWGLKDSVVGFVEHRLFELRCNLKDAQDWQVGDIVKLSQTSGLQLVSRAGEYNALKLAAQRAKGGRPPPWVFGLISKLEDQRLVGRYSPMRDGGAMLIALQREVFNVRNSDGHLVLLPHERKEEHHVLRTSPTRPLIDGWAKLKNRKPRWNRADSRITISVMPFQLLPSKRRWVYYSFWNKKPKLPHDSVVAWSRLHEIYTAIANNDMDFALRLLRELFPMHYEHARQYDPEGLLRREYGINELLHAVYMLLRKPSVWMESMTPAERNRYLARSLKTKLQDLAAPKIKEKQKYRVEIPVSQLLTLPSKRPEADSGTTATSLGNLSDPTPDALATLIEEESREEHRHYSSIKARRLLNLPDFTRRERKVLSLLMQDIKPFQALRTAGIPERKLRSTWNSLRQKISRRTVA